MLLGGGGLMLVGKFISKVLFVKLWVNERDLINILSSFLSKNINNFLITVSLPPDYFFLVINKKNAGTFQSRYIAPAIDFRMIEGLF